MRSLWSLYKSARSQDDDDSDLTSITNSLGTVTIEVASLTTEVATVTGYVVGSLSSRVLNVESASTTIPAAGTMEFDTTRKVVLFSDGTSMFLATGSLA